ncbi:MAG TPA: hypothetical protein VFN92_13165 [Solirubrobacterales bacterium]|nr:hypothetical protein [Solirubrobacterales bacterium]
MDPEGSKVPPLDVLSHLALHAAGARGLINTSQQVGGALGLAVLAAIANSEIGTSTEPAVLTDGFSSPFLVGAGFALLGLLTTLLLIRTADSKAHVELGAEPATESSA